MSYKEDHNLTTGEVQNIEIVKEINKDNISLKDSIEIFRNMLLTGTMVNQVIAKMKEPEIKEESKENKSEVVNVIKINYFKLSIYTFLVLSMLKYFIN